MAGSDQNLQLPGAGVGTAAGIADGDGGVVGAGDGGVVGEGVGGGVREGVCVGVTVGVFVGVTVGVTSIANEAVETCGTCARTSGTCGVIMSDSTSRAPHEKLRI